MERYVVRPGDTLTLIAQRFNTTVAAIVEANDIQNANIIFVGQVLLIPVEETVPPPTPPPHPPRPPRPPEPPTPPAPPTRRPRVVRVFDGVEYIMTLNKPVYSLGEQIIIRFVKRNILSVPLTLTYRTSQRVDFRVTRGNRLYWQWSRGRAFTQARSTLRLRPGEQQVYRVVWNQRSDSFLPRPGIYRLTGWNLATPSVRLMLDFEIDRTTFS